MLKAMVQARASDIHLQAGAPPTVRIDGKLRPFGQKPLSPKEVEALIRSMLTSEQIEEVEYRRELDFAYTIPGFARFRCNLLHQRGSLGLVMRVISEAIPSFEALGLPREVMVNLSERERGLVLITGPTGSGKSTTLAAMLDYINHQFPKNIITIEDPIEFLHRHKRGLVVQREVGVDTESFLQGIKYAMRQDPDVILIGEMRDRETVEAAIMAAQTGHLVFSTLHTLDAVRTINRVLDLFPPHEREVARILFAESLVGIVSQRLLPKVGGGRVCAMEVLKASLRVRDLIKDPDKTQQIYEAMRDAKLDGMQTFDDHLAELYQHDLIDHETALLNATSRQYFKVLALQIDEERGRKA